MFPEVLSNGSVLAKARVDRLAMVCDMQIGRSGELQHITFLRGGDSFSCAAHLYRCGCRASSRGWSPHVPAERVEDIAGFYRLYEVLRGAESRRGALDFDTQETRILFDEQRKIRRD